MDGGLVCRLQLANSELPAYAQSCYPHHSIIVHNVNGLKTVTLTKIARHLKSSFPPKLFMVADSTSFKIFLLFHYYCRMEIVDDSLLTSEERLEIQNDPLIQVYDSATREWKIIVNTSRIIDHDGLGYIISIVMYQGFLYAVFLGFRSKGDATSVWRLLRYNLTVESWENVDASTDTWIDSSLVVSNVCLFLVLWCREDCSDYGMSEEWFFEVREIRTRDMTQETVLKLSAADVMVRLDIKTGSQFGTRPVKRSLEFLNISVIGFESSLFLMSEVCGKSKLFDLVTLLGS